MSKQVSIAEARNALPALVHLAEKGAPVQLTRRGKPVAVLVSAVQFHRLTEGRGDFFEKLEEFRRTHDLEDLGIEEVFAGVRDRSAGRSIRW